MRAAICLAAVLGAVECRAATTQVLAGSTTADLFPPAATSADARLFPPEAVVGNQGTITKGAEPFLYQVAPLNRFPTVQQAFGAVVLPTTLNASASSDFNLIEHWGNQGPRFTAPADTWGLGNATPIAPQGCSITQAHLEPPALFAQAINAAAANGTFNATGELAFLNTWTYKLGAEGLNHYGRQQCYDLGVSTRMAYGHLLRNFTASGKLPVFRAGSSDRMVESMETFGAGFFGRNSSAQFNMELYIETNGYNASLNGADTCPNQGKDYAAGAIISNAFLPTAFNATVARLQPYMLGGFKLTPTLVQNMMSLCTFETLSLGYSPFCSLFTEEEWLNYEYFQDLTYYYNFGPAGISTAAQGKGYIQELVSRLTRTPLSAYNSTTNSTLDSNPLTFPLDQSIYVDGAHDTGLIYILTALNMTAVTRSGPPPNTHRPSYYSFRTSLMFNYAAKLEVQVLSCSNASLTGPQLRFILNDAVLPLNETFDGCSQNSDGLCSVSTATSAMVKRAASIDFAKACNYTGSST